MQPAAEAMQAALATAQVSMPVVPLIANVTAKPVSDPATIRQQLVEQVTGTVRWRESVIEMKAQGVHQVIELGAGKVLAGLIKRIDKEIESLSAGAPPEIEVVLKALS
jgi:[acyl-carrier-protein] S-malonyltransferase